MIQPRPCVIVTGATGAIGREICRKLCTENRYVELVLACRNMAKAEKLADSLRKEYPQAVVGTLELDLADRRSVERAASSLRRESIAGLINNAGVMNREYRQAPGGGELTVAVNYEHTRLLTELLLPMMQSGASIVFTTSLTRFMRRRGAAAEVDERSFSQLGTYGLSKRLITDYAASLAERLKDRDIRVNCADPGIVDSGMITMHRWFDRLADLVFRPFIRSPRDGAIPAMRAFAAPSSGSIYCKRAVHKL